MKKFTPLVLVLFCVLGLMACNQNVVDNNDNDENRVMYMGLKAEIVGIDEENAVIYVKDCDDGDNYFEEKSAIDCKNLSEDKKLIYVDYDTEELFYIELSDLLVGDTIIVDVYADQLTPGENG
ncbi:MAG: hypothetical protein IJP09_00110 [Clostridia bacterium]|nr:hypothetical protein [Clostridia bacterium]